MIRKGHGEILRVCFPSCFQDICIKVKKMAKTTKFLTFTLDFGSKLGFLKVNISKTARETCPQNFTMIFAYLTSLKNRFVIFGGFLFLGIDFGSTCCEWLHSF